MKRKPRSQNYKYEQDFDYDDSYEPQDKKKKNSLLNTTSMAVLAAVLMLGIAIGAGFGSMTASVPGKIVTLTDLETRAPNADLCVQFGSSAIATDLRVFVTLNPLNIFVSQPTTRPGCVLRSNNWSVLEQRGLLKSDQMRDCKQRMNTFGYTGALESSPQIDCVYQNDAAKNLFLNEPGIGNVAKPENQRF